MHQLHHNLQDITSFLLTGCTTSHLTVYHHRLTLYGQYHLCLERSRTSHHITSAPSLSTFCCRLKMHLNGCRLCSCNASAAV